MLDTDGVIMVPQASREDIWGGVLKGMMNNYYVLNDEQRKVKGWKWQKTIMETSGLENDKMKSNRHIMQSVFQI